MLKIRTVQKDAASYPGLPYSNFFPQKPAVYCRPTLQLSIKHLNTFLLSDPVPGKALAGKAQAVSPARNKSRAPWLAAIIFIL
jgi:hypothetical protein